MRTQEEIKKGFYKIAHIWYKHYEGDIIGREIVLAAASIKEARELAKPEILKRAPKFSESLVITGITFNDKFYKYQEELK